MLGRDAELGKVERTELLEQSEAVIGPRQVDLVEHEKVCVNDRPTSSSSRYDSLASRVLVAFSRSSTGCTTSMPSSLPMSITSSTRSLPRIRPRMLESNTSTVIGGVSMSCTFTSSHGIMPGCGSRVVNGYGATSGVARVSLASSWLLPALGPPMIVTRPAPCRWM